MLRLELRQRIAAPPERVFAAFADVRGMPDRVRSVVRVEVPDGAEPGPGFRWRETRRLFGVEGSENFEMRDFQPPQRFTVFSHARGADFTTTFSFRPDGDDTEVVMLIVAEPRTAQAAMMVPLAKMMLPQMEAAFRGDLEDMKRSIEENQMGSASGHGT